MGFPSSFKNVEFCQQIRYLKGFSVDKLKADLGEWTPICKYAFIIHDECKDNNGNLKEPHIHLLMQFWNPQPTDSILAHFGKLFGEGVTVQCLEKCKRWTSAVAYLTHENKPEKHQYSRDKVVASYDFNEDADEGKNANKDLRLSEIMGLIDREEMREYNITEYVSIDEHHKYKRAIEDALAYVYSRKAKEVNRHMDVMYISGPAGSGKTTFAKWYCEQQKMSYTVSSSSNDPMQDYKGQDVLILDDFRPSEWKMTDFLKLLDNHTTSSVRSRYQNKYMCYCKCIIITSVIPLSKVWDFLQDKDDKEPLEQLYRRITMDCEMSAKEVTMRVGDNVLKLANPSVEYLKDKQSEQLRITANLTAIGFKQQDTWLNDVENVKQIEMEFSKNDSSTDFNIRLKHDQAVYKAQEKKRTTNTRKNTKTPKKAK